MFEVARNCIQLTVERLLRGETGLLKEVVRVADERVSGNDLDEIDHDGDLGSDEVTTLEALKVGSRFLELLLEEIGLLDSEKQLVNVWPVLGRGKSHQRFPGVLLAALTDEPVRRLGSERQAAQDGHGPDPLDGLEVC